MAPSSPLLLHLHLRRRLLHLFLLVTALLSHSSCVDDDNDHVVLKCESSIVNDGGTVINEAKTAIYFLLNSPYPTAYIHYTSIYGLSWCRSDISTTFCSSCLSIAANNIRKNCPSNTVAARFLYYDFCYLRIDAKNFIGQPDTSFSKIWFNTAFDIAHKALYWEQVDRLLNRVKQETPGPVRKFIELNTTFEIERLKITGMALCSRDLSEEGCGYCLNLAMAVIKIKCVFQAFCEVLYGSCFLKFRATQI